jgi:hypothetical protein
MPLATIFYKRKRKGCNIVSSWTYHNLQLVEGGQYLVEVEQ